MVLNQLRCILRRHIIVINSPFYGFFPTEYLDLIESKKIGVIEVSEEMLFENEDYFLAAFYFLEIRILEFSFYKKENSYIILCISKNFKPKEKISPYKIIITNTPNGILFSLHESK